MLDYESDESPSSSDVILHDCIIAYIDILGTKDILNSNDEERIQIFIHNLKECYGEIEESDDIIIRIFSDNILLFNSYSVENVHRIMAVSSMFQCYMLMKYGLLVRGGIVRGKLYYDERFVIGKGLVDAYSLEQSEQKSPRILLDEMVSKLDSNAYTEGNEHSINYLDYTMDYDDGLPNTDEIIKHKRILEKLLKDNANESDRERKESIKKKIDWAIGYHNWYCRKNDMDASLLIVETGNALE